MHLASRVATLESSITLALAARARAIAATGRDVVDMTVGEPDRAAPAVARAAAVEKVEGGDVRYTPAAGTPALRAALAAELARTRGGEWSADEVVVCHSGKHALSGCLLALVEPGDDVLIPLPAWVSYFEQVKVTGGRAVPVAPADGCRPDLDAIGRAWTDRTRVVMINSPSNPSGVVWTEDELGALVDLAAARGGWILSDEIYRRLVLDGPPAVGPTGVRPDAKAFTAIVDGASKAFAMTGYRIGSLAGPVELVGAVARLHSQTTGSPNAVSQEAWLAAISGDPPEVEELRRSLVARRDRVVAGLEALGLELPRPEGAFYAFPRVPYDGGSVALCERLLEEHDLALIPGAAFGMDDRVRLSFAIPAGRIDAAIERLGAFLGGG